MKNIRMLFIPLLLSVVALAYAQPVTRGAAGSIPGDNIMRYYRLAIPITHTAYQVDLGGNYNNVKVFWQECEDFVNKVFVPLGVCFDVVVDERLVMSAPNKIDNDIFTAPSDGTILTDAAIGSDSYDVGMWVMHRDYWEENSGLSVEAGVYSQSTKSGGYSKTDKWVVAHEIGHLFGAGHTAQGEGSLMDNDGEFFSYPSIKKIRESLMGKSYPSGKSVSNSAPIFDSGRMKDTYTIPQGACMAIPIYATDAGNHNLAFSAIGCSSSNVDNVKEGGILPHFASLPPQADNVVDYRPVYSADVIYDDFYYTQSGTEITDMDAGSYSIAFLVNDVPESTDYASLYASPFYSNYAVWDATVRIVGGTPFSALLSPYKSNYSAGEQVTVLWSVNDSYFTNDSRLRITMSTDYGKTFNYVLAESVPATAGRCSVTLPDVNVGNVNVDFITVTRSMRAGIIRVEEIGGVAYTLTTLSPENGGGFTVTGGADTGVPGVNVSGVSPLPVYDLGGRVVNGVTSSGIYIRDGKKMIIRQ